MKVTEGIERIVPSTTGFREAVRVEATDMDAPIFWSLVRRVRTERGSHIVPDFNPSWSEHDRLRWWAATLRVDFGVRVTVHKGGYRINGREVPGYFSISYPGGGASGGSYDETRRLLDGIAMGIYMHRGGPASDG